MTTEVKVTEADIETTDQHTQADDLVRRLRAWSPLIASGYECPAASTALDEAAATIKELKAEVESEKALAQTYKEQLDAFLSQKLAAEARAAKAEEALRKHGKHEVLCAAVGAYGYCSCGLDEALGEGRA